MLCPTYRYSNANNMVFFCEAICVALLVCFTPTAGDDSLVEVAKGKPAVQSSVGHSAYASRAVDGNTNTGWHSRSCVHTNSDQKPFWRVDLLENFVVAQIRIYNRMDCCSSRISFSKLLVGTSKSEDAMKLCATTPDMSGRAVIDLECSNHGILGRYVELRIPRQTILNLCEVQVFTKKPPILYNNTGINALLEAWDGDFSTEQKFNNWYNMRQYLYPARERRYYKMTSEALIFPEQNKGGSIYRWLTCYKSMNAESVSFEAVVKPNGRFFLWTSEGTFIGKCAATLDKDDGYRSCQQTVDVKSGSTYLVEVYITAAQSEIVSVAIRLKAGVDDKLRPMTEDEFKYRAPDKPSIHLDIGSILYLPEGRQKIVRYTVIGFPSTSIRWTRNGQLIMDKAELVGIDTSNPAHYGCYQISAENIHGETMSQFIVLPLYETLFSIYLQAGSGARDTYSMVISNRFSCSNITYGANFLDGAVFTATLNGVATTHTSNVEETALEESGKLHGHIRTSISSTFSSKAHHESAWSETSYNKSFSFKLLASSQNKIGGWSSFWSSINDDILWMHDRDISVNTTHNQSKIASNIEWQLNEYPARTVYNVTIELYHNQSSLRGSFQLQILVYFGPTLQVTHVWLNKTACCVGSALNFSTHRLSLTVPALYFVDTLRLLVQLEASSMILAEDTLLLVITYCEDRNCASNPMKKISKHNCPRRTGGNSPVRSVSFVDHHQKRRLTTCVNRRTGSTCISLVNGDSLRIFGLPSKISSVSGVDSERDLLCGKDELLSDLCVDLSSEPWQLISKSISFTPTSNPTFLRQVDLVESAKRVHFGSSELQFTTTGLAQYNDGDADRKYLVIW